MLMADGNPYKIPAGVRFPHELPDWSVHITAIMLDCLSEHTGSTPVRSANFARVAQCRALPYEGGVGCSTHPSGTQCVGKW